MTISLRLSAEESALIKNYAELKKVSVSELIRQTVMEKIEDEIDLVAYNSAMAEYRQNPVTFSLDDVEKELGLNGL
ncbi:type II toxin-antitoxin system RelB family antitoxin [Phascolarctobacterium sp.]|uniref:type II toxin-antitoxin system RelB family antitoxin n=1 Tax=Phascolarctobacterium sp. TaxID=2049039 RepID=UPI00386EB391